MHSHNLNKARPTLKKGIIVSVEGKCKEVHFSVLTSPLCRERGREGETHIYQTAARVPCSHLVQ